ncbi:MAG: ABC transporter permease [Elusimicrobiota bacterium]
MNAVWALWLRQIKRYFRSRSRLIGSLGQPLLFLLALGFGFGPIFHKAGGGNYIQFLIPGIIAMGVLFTAVFSGIEVIWDRQFGFLKETLVAPVSRVSIMLGRTLGGATVAVIQGLLVLGISFLAGFRLDSAIGIIPAAVFMALIAILFTALGTAIASVLEDMQGFQLIMNFLIMPLFFFSGSLFPLSGLPRFLGVLAAMNPLTYGVDGLRLSLSGGSYAAMGIDAAVLSSVAAVIVIIGGGLFSRIQA